MSWSDSESCKVFTAVTRKDRPENDDLQETSGLITLDDIYEKNHRLFVHFDLENMKSTSSKNTNTSFTCDNAIINDAEPSLDIVSTNSSPSQSAPKSIFDVLMKAQNHYPRVKSGVKLRRDVQQYNSIISFITASGLGVAGTNLSEYERLVEKFAKLLWEVDPHYSKLQARGKSFPKLVEEKFLNFNRPQDYKMKSKNVSTPSLALKVNEIKTLMDRKFMSANKLKKLHDIVKTVIEAISEYFDILEDQRVRSHKNSQKDVRKEETSLDEFVITKVKMRVPMSDSYYKENYNKIRTALNEADMYEPVMLNSLLNVGTGHKLRTQQYRFIEDMLKNGLPFVIPLVDVCHFKLPSQGPHKAVHFVWKKPRGDEDDDPQ